MIKKANKSIISLLLILLFITALFNSGCSNKVEEKTEVKIWSALNSEKILQNSQIGEGKGELTFNTFIGDVESAQLIFTPNAYVSSFDFKMGDVKDSNGNVLGANLFEVYAQKYIKVSIPTSRNTMAGMYPDAIIPLRNYLLKREGKVEKDTNQGLWINLNVPKDAKAGKYTGTAVLTIEETEYDVPVNVNIYNIEMPDENHKVNSFYLDYGMIGIGENVAVTDELKNTYYNFMINKRVNVRNFPKYEGVNTKYNAVSFANDVVSYVENPMVSSYALPYSSVTSEYGAIVDYNYCYEVLNELAKKNVELIKGGKQIDLFKKAHFYLGALIDEPTPSSYDKVRACDINIQKAKLAVASTGVLDNYPEVKESLLTLKHVVTSAINSDLYGTDEVGGVQTWCPLIDKFSSSESIELAKSRMLSRDRTGGEGVWWYTCINPKNPYPSYHIDDVLLSSRLMSWMEYDYKIQGTLYWNVNYWQRYLNYKAQTTDVWSEPLSWESANGDGRLIYPGSKYGIVGPISSVRLENLRESSEDYEILWLFEQTINKINADFDKNYDSDKILSYFYNKIIDCVFIKTGVTVKDFENNRLNLLSLLEKMVNNPNNAISELDKIN